MYETFDERNELCRRLDHIPTNEQVLILHRTLGWLSPAGAKLETFWSVIEKYILEYENRQPVLPLTLTQDKNEPFLESVLDALDKGYSI